MKHWLKENLWVLLLYFLGVLTAAIIYWIGFENGAGKL